MDYQCLGGRSYRRDIFMPFKIRMGDKVGDNKKCDAETPVLSVFFNYLFSPKR